MSDTQLFEKYGRTLAAGHIVFREGDEGDQMYIVQAGRVRVSRLFDGAEHVLAVLGKGEFFGEMALITRERRMATVTALAATDLLVFDRAGFKSMIEKNPRIAMNVIDKLCRRLRTANMQIQRLARRNEKSLVAMNLQHAFEASGGAAVARERLLEDICLVLGVPNQDVAAILEAFAGEGVIVVGGDSISLRDEAGLARLAGA